MKRQILVCDHCNTEIFADDDPGVSYGTKFTSSFGTITFHPVDGYDYHAMCFLMLTLKELNDATKETPRPTLPERIELADDDSPASGREASRPIHGESSSRGLDDVSNEVTRGLADSE